MSVIPTRQTPDGFTIARIHYSIIPDYDFRAASEGLSRDQVAQELEIDWNASSDKRVYPNFSEIHIAADPVPFDPDLPLLCGWDLPGTPAWCPTQLQRDGTWVLWPPLVGDDAHETGVYEFGQMVYERLLGQFCEPYDLPYERLRMTHWGDPAGNSRPNRTLATSNPKLEQRSAYSVLEKGGQVITGFHKGEPIIEERPGWGWQIGSGAVSLGERLQRMRDRLDILIGGRPALLVDPNLDVPDADYLVRACKGGYCYKQKANGRYEDEPDKGWFSHGINAAEYVVTRLAKTLGRRPEPEEPPRRRQPVRSHASGIRGEW